MKQQRPTSDDKKRKKKSQQEKEEKMHTMFVYIAQWTELHEEIRKKVNNPLT